MSSTNRKNASERHVSDYYVTPIKDVRDFIREWGGLTDDMLILDPCAGGDVTHEMSYPTALNRAIDTIDIREDSLAEVKGDFLTMDIEKKYDLVITNPPFNLAQEIIEKAHEVTKEGGHIVMLLRLNFLGSKARKAFWEKYPPYQIFVHHRRMSFQDDGGTDSIEYAHFVWKKGVSPDFAQLRII